MLTAEQYHDLDKVKQRLWRGDGAVVNASVDDGDDGLETDDVVNDAASVDDGDDGHSDMVKQLHTQCHSKLLFLLLSYDTMFNVGEFYMSVLSLKLWCLKKDRPFQQHL